MTNSIPIRTPLQYVEGWAFHLSDGDHQVIMQMILNHSPGGRILDLGCGPMLPAWAIFHSRVDSLVGLDRHRGNIEFLEKCRATHARPQTFLAAEHISRKLCPHPPTLDMVYDRISEIREGDVIMRQADWAGVFDVVTQIGCFACLPQNRDVDVAISNVASYLRPEGLFLSVMWHAQPDFIEDPVWGGNERTQNRRPINGEYVRKIAAGLGFRLLFEECLPSDEIGSYRAFTVQAFRYSSPQLL